MSYWYPAGAERSAALSFLPRAAIDCYFYFFAFFFLFASSFYYTPFFIHCCCLSASADFFFSSSSFCVFSSCLSLSSTSLCIFCRSLLHFYMHVRLLSSECLALQLHFKFRRFGLLIAQASMQSPRNHPGSSNCRFVKFYCRSVTGLVRKEVVNLGHLLAQRCYPRPCGKHS